jgi:branched-chain amino acid transport system ATP-binding protein
MLLKVEAISSGYAGKRVVRQVSLEVDRGEVVALVGANGAGKSTLLDSIFGIRPVEEGQIRFAGAVVTNRTPAGNLRDGIAYAPQGGRVYRTLTIAENLEIGGFTAPAKVRSKAITQVYERFPILFERRTGRAGSLSGGERQMLALGMALASSPKMILLDEPSGGLSPLYVERSFEMIRRIATEMSMAVLLVEQNLNEAFVIADRAYVMTGGRIVAHGTPDSLGTAAELSALYFGQSEGVISA